MGPWLSITHWPRLLSPEDRSGWEDEEWRVSSGDVSATGLFSFPLQAVGLLLAHLLLLASQGPKFMMTNSHRFRQLQGCLLQQCAPGGPGWKSRRQHPNTLHQFQLSFLTP